MERKIGEIFKIDGEWFQCVRSILTCSSCKAPRPCTKFWELGYCSPNMRTDQEQVVFKKLEKVGEPIKFGNKLMQNYNIFVEPYVPKELEYFIIESARDLSILIELKQTKEDMEEKRLNLKPFDLEAAKAGKPVCTRDGRKARIICFDRLDDQPILALVETSNRKKEDVYYYSISGRRTNALETGLDLMMLPEKERRVGECIL